MNLLEKLRARLVETQKGGVTQERDTIKVAVAAIETAATSKTQGTKPLTEDQMVGIVRQIVNGNKEALAMIAENNQSGSGYYKKLQAENAVLEPYLPQVMGASDLKTLLESQVEALKAAKSDGMANGVAMKYLKTPGLLQEGIAVDGKIVAEVVKEIRRV